MIRRVAILGAGGWGTAVAIVLKQNDLPVRVWGHNGEYARQIQRDRRNPIYLPEVRIPDGIEFTADLAHALEGADIVVSAIPVKYLRASLKEITQPVRDAGPLPIVSLSKGIDVEKFHLPTQILSEALGDGREVAVLTGPSHAEEVARGLPTAVSVASSGEIKVDIQRAFSTPAFRVYTSDDLIGCELAGALKNVISIAGGIADGLNFGDNTRSALLTRGLAEMTRFGAAMGAKIETFYGLAGMGDLITSCSSTHGRNRHVGVLLAQGRTLNEVLDSMATVAEGVLTTKAVHQIAKTKGIAMPITDQIHEVLYGNQTPRQAVIHLMTRAQKAESAQ
jgi:glycerol-3-phosphate dehydrogenase (NAD(P)+)